MKSLHPHSGAGFFHTLRQAPPLPLAAVRHMRDAPNREFGTGD